jgi:hypothetical protein
MSFFKRATGIEPALEAWKASVQPQHFARKYGRAQSYRRGSGCLGNEVCGHYPSMQIPGVHIETLHNPVRYTYAQIEKACAIAQMLNRGKLVLVEPPQR